MTDVTVPAAISEELSEPPPALVCPSKRAGAPPTPSLSWRRRGRGGPGQPDEPPQRPIRDNAPTRALAAVGITVAWLPFRSPEPNSCEAAWRHRAGAAANRVHPTLDDLAAQALTW